MLEHAWNETGPRFKAWLAALLLLIGIGGFCYSIQLGTGLGVTGMSRDVSWGLYIGQFTFFVGVAASAVMVVLPYYLHDVKVFGRITIVGEFLAVTAVIMCILFILVDLGMPSRLLNIMLYPSPGSVLFWDMVVLNGYFFLNLLTGWKVLEAEYTGIQAPDWVKPLIYIAIPWAFSIHTVTAFIYSGIPGRDFWLTALTAPKFLASAFATGPALLILISLALRRFTGFDAGQEAIRRLSIIVTYAMSITVFMIMAEFFTAFYSHVPSHMYALKYFFVGLYGGNSFVLISWIFAVLCLLALILLLNPKTRGDEKWLTIACASTFIALAIEKGISFTVGGFITNPFGRVTEYWPTAIEFGIVVGVWALGAFLLSLFYSLFVTVKRRSERGLA